MSVHLGLIEKESRNGKESNLTPLSFLHKSKGNFILTIAMPTSPVASSSELAPGLRLHGFRSLPRDSQLCSLGHITLPVWVASSVMWGKSGVPLVGLLVRL